MRQVQAPTEAHFAAASAVVRRHLVPTPVVAAPQLGPEVLLKIETVQPTGTFKVRGGLAAVAAALEIDREAHLVASSAGNHGLGVAFAASRLGAEVTIVVPENASAPKVEALERFDVRIVRRGNDYNRAEAHALELAQETSSRFISPYNDPDVIAGQATIGEELLAQVPGLATIIVPVGGGGLIAGIAKAVAGRGVRVVGVEPAESACMAAAMAAGHVVDIEIGRTIADGLAGNFEPGSITIDLAIELGIETVAVPEAEILQAVRFMANNVGLVTEGSAAVAAGALVSGRLELEEGPAVLVVTGRNIAPALFIHVLDG